MEPPPYTLKVIVIVHFILTLWASMPGEFLPISYTYMNAFILAFGVWGMVNQESAEPISTFLILNLFSIIQDIIFLGLYQPLGYLAYSTTDFFGTFNFAFGMSIVNLILKPVSCYLLYRIYVDRGGVSDTFTIPGLAAGHCGPGGTYENIDQPVPSNHGDSDFMRGSDKLSH
ncbi:type-1 angiotensin II receptor-associated protein-like [Argonauta hians]